MSLSLLWDCTLCVPSKPSCVAFYGSGWGPQEGGAKATQPLIFLKNVIATRILGVDLTLYSMLFLLLPLSFKAELLIYTLCIGCEKVLNCIQKRLFSCLNNFCVTGAFFGRRAVKTNTGRFTYHKQCNLSAKKTF